MERTTWWSREDAGRNASKRSMRPRNVNCGSRPSGHKGKAASQRKSVTSALGNSTGVETTACIEGMHMKHGKPTATAVATATGNPRGPGPVASVAERLVVAWKPGNAGGAKGPHFGHVDGRDKGIAIGFGLATQKKRTRASRKRLDEGRRSMIVCPCAMKTCVFQRVRVPPGKGHVPSSN